jgi:hypothetical protein
MHLPSSLARALPVALLGVVVLAAATPRGGSKPDADATASLERRRDDLLSDVRLYRARLALANGDSMYLVLDGRTKTLALELGGVPLRACSLLAIRLDRRLDRERRTAAFQESLAYPFPLIAKEGTVTEYPPPMDVDTSAAMRKWRDEEKKRDVRFALRFGRDLIVHVTTRADESGGPKGFWPRLEARWHRTKTALEQVLGFRVRGQEPADLFLLMDRRDALAIYRALPEKTGMALRL